MHPRSLSFNALSKKTLLTAVFAGLTFASTGAAAPNPLAGEIVGQVKSTHGIAQMGATVFLYNRADELVSRGFTNEQGRFAFNSLLPDIYSIRVLLASFAPAERRNISVLPSSENHLEIDLTSVLSTVQLGASSVPGGGPLLSDDWKWVLRTSQATRPVLRLLPETKTQQISSSERHPAVSNTWGVLKVSAGDGQSFAGSGEQNLGTSFALGASVAGFDRVQLSGNVGYTPNSGLPAAGLRTSYTHRMPDGSSPTLAVTAQQIYLTPRAGAGDSVPSLRTISAAFLDSMDLSDTVHVDYGMDLQSISYNNRQSSVSPFVRVTYNAGAWGRIRAAASWGGRPTELLVRDAETVGNLDPTLMALGALPRLSRSNDRLTMQRSRNGELGWERSNGNRTYSVGIYREEVSNANFMLSAPTNFVPATDLLPDLNSQSSIFNVGSYDRTGYGASIKQKVGDHAEVSVAAGRTGALTAGPTASVTYDDAQDLRAGIRKSQQNWVTVRAAGVIPLAKTRVSANYGWIASGVMMPVHVLMTQTAGQDVGVNFFIRQPVPISGVPWRLEATAEIRNMLAQGYLSLGGATSQSILTNSPRAMRGGLNIIF